jgi:transposase
VSFTVDGDQVKIFKIFNQGRGFGKLLSEIARLKERHRCSHVLVGMEPTGHYWYPLAYFLEKHKQAFVTVSPAHVKWAKQLEDNSPLKTDPKDAGVIAELVRQGKYLQMVLPKGVYAHLRKLSSMRHQRVTTQSAQKNLLRRILDEIFPEFAGLFSDLLGKTAQALLRRYPIPRKVIEVGVEQLEDFIEHASHRRLGQAKAHQVFQAAQDSIGITEGMESQLLDLSQTLDTLQLLRKQIADIERRQQIYLSQVPYASYLLSVPGIGPVTVATLLGEIGNMEAYSSSRELVKLAGLNLYEISSGIHQGKRRISKRGRPRLRKALYCAIIPMIRHNGVFQAKYQALRARGKAPQQAMIALCRKLLRVLFALVRTQQHFAEEYLMSRDVQQAA